MLDIHTYAAPIAITLLYISVYYGFQIRLIFVKARLSKAYAARGEKFDRYFGQDREMLAADRAQLNMLEQMGPFLTLMWLHAVFVSPTGAAGAGMIYILARLAYPFMVGPRMGRGPRGRILLSTAPGYAVLIYLCGGIVWALAR